ncbi:MAG TPA: hypothetical protein VN456_18070 [Desulfosporosinus sp.]|nr:hypothetical protein [Desulfosporosinus sp.]
MAISDNLAKNRYTTGIVNTIFKRKQAKKFKRAEDKKRKNEKMLKDVIDTALPVSFKPSKDGLWIETNDTWIQCMVIGRISPKYGDRQDFPTELDQRFMDEVFDIATTPETCIELCQVVYPLNPLHENDALETAKRNIKIANVIQETDDKFLHQHDTINDFAAEGIYEYQKQLFHGKTRLLHHVLLVAVQGLTKKAVKKTIKDIETVCDSKVIQHELPQHGMVETYKSMQPTPYVWGYLFKKSVTAELCAKTSLLRNPEPKLATKGRMLGMNTRTGNPIYYDFDDPNTTNSNALIIAPSGSGKSVNLLTDDIRAYLDGDNVIHIVPKKDGKTDHLRVCAALNGQLWKVGFGGQNPNMFQVFFDKSVMDDSRDGYQAAYLAHFTMLLECIGLLIGSGYTDQQKNWLTQALSELYEEFHVINGEGEILQANVSKWNEGTFWPNFTDLRNKLENWLKDDKHSKMSGPIEALFNNTAMLTPNGPLGYLVNNNALDLSNQFIMADLSALTSVPNVQEALTMMIMSVVYTKLANAKPGIPINKTLLTLDEGADLIKNPTMEKSIEKFFRQGRAWGMYTKVVSQDLAGFPRTMLDMIKANTSYILLLGNWRSDNVGPIQKEFILNDQDVSVLTTPGKGYGLLVLAGHRLPYYNALDEFEEAAILNKGPLSKEMNKTIYGQEIDTNEDENDTTHGDIVINPVVSQIVHDLRVSCKTWYNKSLKMSEYPNGFEKETVRNPYTGVNTVAFYKKSLLDEDGYIKGQTTEHYFMNALLAGEGYLHGAESVTVENNYGKDQPADVQMVFPLPNGLKLRLAFEYETKECKHSVKDLQEKRDKLILLKECGASCFDGVMFIARKEYVDHIISAVGDDHTLTRGAAVGQYIESMKAQKMSAHMPQLAVENAEAA